MFGKCKLKSLFPGFSSVSSLRELLRQVTISSFPHSFGRYVLTDSNNSNNSNNIREL